MKQVAQREKSNQNLDSFQILRVEKNRRFVLSTKVAK